MSNIPAADRYYRSSSAAPLSGLALMWIGGLVSAVVFSFLYAWIDFVSPDVRLNFIATAAFVCGLGGMMRLTAMIGAVRSASLARMVSLFIGIIALYFAWVWFLFILSGWQWLILDPIAIWGALVELGAEGIWTFENTTPKGWALYSLWIVEALLTILVPVAIVGTNPKPYCEACRTWTRKHLEPIWCANRDAGQFREALEQERYEELSDRSHAYDAADAVQLEIWSCPKCEESNYLSATRVQTKGTGSNAKVKRTPLFKLLHVPPHALDEAYKLTQPQTPQFASPETFRPAAAPGSSPAPPPAQK